MPPRAIINSAGYKVLTSVDQYLELVGNSLPGKGPVAPGPIVLLGPEDWPGKEVTLSPLLGLHSAGQPVGPRMSADLLNKPSPQRGGSKDL